MTNSDFRQYLQKRLAQVRKDIENPEVSQTAREGLRYAEKDITTMLKIMALGGKSARRVRRDYERRLAKRGIDINAL